MNWQPIETCPETGDFIIAFKKGTVLPASRSKTRWMFYDGQTLYGSHFITHWMPLPEPPHDPE